MVEGDASPDSPLVGPSLAGSPSKRKSHAGARSGQSSRPMLHNSESTVGACPSYPLLAKQLCRIAPVQWLVLSLEWVPFDTALVSFMLPTVPFNRAGIGS